MTGKVWITGAGSEAGLITVSGLKALREAQVVVYDDLLDHSLLREVPEGCEKVCVGKRKNAHKMEQEEIHALLIDRARKGLQVVRLKGGDPTVFGRGGEEALALEEAGVPYEMIPGVSSCISAPEPFGIPITQWDIAGLGRSRMDFCRPGWTRTRLSACSPAPLCRTRGAWTGGWQRSRRSREKYRRRLSW